ncbi:MAG: DUF4446 family protein [Candidatus Limnocylindrales bacterium]
MPDSLAAPLALAALVVAALALLMGVAAFRRADRKAAIRPLPALVDAEALEAHLGDQNDRLDAIATEMERTMGRTVVLEGQSAHAIQHIGLVRYNPFEDTGSNQSFALAVLDAEANGIILSSLHSRQQTRAYVKEIVGGKCDSALSAEESEALARAGIAV